MKGGKPCNIPRHSWVKIMKDLSRGIRFGLTLEGLPSVSGVRVRIHGGLLEKNIYITNRLVSNVLGKVAAPSMTA